MKTRAWRVEEEGALQALDVEAAFSAGIQGRGTHWIDVECEDRVQRADPLLRLGLDRDLVDVLLEAGHASRALSVPGGLFFEFPLRFEGSPPELRSVSFLCLEGLVLTLRGISLGVEVEPQTFCPECSSSAGIVLALLLEWSMQIRTEATEVRHRTFELSRRLDDDPEGLSCEEILRLRRRLVDLDSVCEEREAALENLQFVRSSALDLDSVAESLRVVLGNTAATNRRVERFDRRVADLRLQVDDFQREKLSRRLSRLTVISAIFLPLTLVAGIYGMNFQGMPELDHPAGYPIVLGGMLALGLGLFLWFRRRGWMD